MRAGHEKHPGLPSAWIWGCLGAIVVKEGRGFAMRCLWWAPSLPTKPRRELLGIWRLNKALVEMPLHPSPLKSSLVPLLSVCRPSVVSVCF